MSIEIREILTGIIVLAAFFLYTLWVQYLAWKKPHKVKYLHIFEFDEPFRMLAVSWTKGLGPIFSLIAFVLLVGVIIELIRELS